MTPLGQGFPQQMVPGLNPFPPPFVPRSKRSASMSVGGPPKAVLGGPQRKVSPIPPTPAAPAAPPSQKQKKIVVNLPRETVPADGGEPPTRASFARMPLVESEIPVQVEVRYPETSTVELYPPDSWRYHLPPTVDVFLPGKVRVLTVLQFFWRPDVGCASILRAMEMELVWNAAVSLFCGSPSSISTVITSSLAV